MTPSILVRTETRLIGLSLQMSLAANKTQELWSSFMPRRKEVEGKLSSECYSLQIYPAEFMHGRFGPNTPFMKWAGVPVNEEAAIPAGMAEFRIPAGKYAMFTHKGTAQEFRQTWQQIYDQWLPQSGYQLREAPHFEILGERYKGHDNPESEEEVWIPIG